MPVIINELEIVAEPVAGTDAVEMRSASTVGNTQIEGGPVLSPSVVHEILERASERGLRTFAH